MSLDLHDALVQMQDLDAEVHKRVDDLDALQTLSLTADEQELASRVQGLYHVWEIALAALIAAINEVLKLGYPVLPTLSAPQSMVDHIDQIINQIKDAETLLKALQAAKMKVTFSPPESQ